MRFLDKQTYVDAAPQLADLFLKSFKKEISVEFLRWRYIDNPCGDILAAVEEDSGEIIANYSASPNIITYFGEEFKTALSMTTMTDPAFAGRGLFTSLASSLYEEMQCRGYSLIWGFPNVQSHSGFISRLGWFDIYEIPTMRVSMDGIKMERMEWVEDNQFELDYSATFRNNEYLTVKKSRDYLVWRYARHPINKYRNIVIANDGEVSSYCVIKKYGESLDVIDLQVQNKEHCQELLRQVLALAGSEQLKLVNCWAPRHHFIHSVCERLKFVNREPITYFGASMLKNNPTIKDAVGSFSGWYLQMGDSDVY